MHPSGSRYLAVLRQRPWVAALLAAVLVAGAAAVVLTLPHSHLEVIYTTKVVHPSGNRLATPDIVITPTISQVLAGTDPVLDRALSYPLPSRAGR